MSTADELALVAKAQGGDLAARNALIEHHVPFIFKRVQSCIPKWIPVQEYLSHGVEAFIKGVNGFDPALGCKLLTFCGTSIERQCWRAWSQRSLVRVAHVDRKKRTEKYLAQQKRAMTIKSIDATRVVHGRERTLKELLAARMVCEDRGERHERNLMALRRAMVILEERDGRGAAIIWQAMQGKTLRSVGIPLGICRERVRQLKNEAMASLRQIMGVDEGQARAA